MKIENRTDPPILFHIDFKKVSFLKWSYMTLFLLVFWILGYSRVAQRICWFWIVGGVDVKDDEFISFSTPNHFIFFSTF